jgi:hypothetical protein
VSPWRWWEHLRRRALEADRGRARMRNELAQLSAIRDELAGRAGDPRLAAWCNGAIFTLSWLVGEPGAKSPSEAAHHFRIPEGT